MSGQGTSLALVAAYVLAGELAGHPGDHGSAFVACERRLRRFVAIKQGGLRNDTAALGDRHRAGQGYDHRSEYGYDR